MIRSSAWNSVKMRAGERAEAPVCASAFGGISFAAQVIAFPPLSGRRPPATPTSVFTSPHVGQSGGLQRRVCAVSQNSAERGDDCSH